MPDIWNELPDTVKKALEHSPFAFVLTLVIVGFLTGYIVTGRTFDREMSKCEAEVKEYKGLAFEAAKQLDEQVSERRRARHQPTVSPAPDAEAPTIKDRLSKDTQELKKAPEK